MRIRVVIFLLAVGFLPAGLALAQTANSTNFQNTDSSILPLIVNVQSGSFQIDGAVEAIVGKTQSASMILESGSQNSAGTAPVVVPPPPGPSGGGGGGGGGFPLEIPGTIPTTTAGLPVINSHRWTYKTTALIQGSRGADNALITVNGSENGVTYLSVNRWEFSLPLGLGNNFLFVQSNGGERVTSTVRRRLIGDVNDSQLVDDVDLSLFTRHWKVYDIQSDFNEDNAIDDIDLSLLASHWGRKF